MTPTRTLHGFHAVTARLKLRPESIRAVYLAGARPMRGRATCCPGEGAGCAVEAADDARLAELSGTDRHQGVVALVEAQAAPVTLDEVLDALAEPALLLVLDGVTDPHNLGACRAARRIRGRDAVVVPKDRAVGVNATVAKAASGAADTVPVVTVTNLARPCAR